MASVLSLVAVHKRYRRSARQEVVVLDGATMELHPGDFACVIGERSSGKSTLLEIAAGLRSPGSGTVLHLGQDVAGMRERARARLRRTEVASIWNRSIPAIHAGTVLDHVALPLISSGVGRKQRRAAAAAMLERVGEIGSASEALVDLPDGRRTRVALAQACVRQPKVLLIDELRDTLGLAERNAILGVLQSFAQDGTSILLTAADAHGAVGCNRLLSLSNGRLVEAQQPSHGTVIAFPGASSREAGSAG